MRDFLHTPLKDQEPEADPQLVVGCKVEGEVFHGLTCLEAYLGRGEWETESITYQEALNEVMTCVSCEEPLLECQGKTPRTFTCCHCGRREIRPYPGGDMVFCCQSKMMDSLKEIPHQAALKRLRENRARH